MSVTSPTVFLIRVLFEALVKTKGYLLALKKITEAVKWKDVDLNGQTVADGYFEPAEECILLLFSKLDPLAKEGYVNKIQLRDFKDLAHTVNKKRASFKHTKYITTLGRWSEAMTPEAQEEVGSKPLEQ